MEFLTDETFFVSEYQNMKIKKMKLHISNPQKNSLYLNDKNFFLENGLKKRNFVGSSHVLKNYYNIRNLNELRLVSKVKSKLSFLENSMVEENKLSSTEVFFNTCFDKNNLKSLIAWFLEKYGQKLTVDLVETLKQVGFHQATRAGVSLGIDDLQIPPQKTKLLSQASTRMENVTNSIQTGNLTSVEKSQRLIDTWNQTSETLRQTAVHNFRTANPVNPVYMMAFSGARGNISQVRQLVAMRGLMADPQGAILEFPIQSNFREGLTVTEYLISCYGARKGLVDTALRTATSGYLTRRLVDAVQHVVVHVTDCHTQQGILIKEKNIEQRLVGRVLLEEIQLTPSLIIKKNTLISGHLAKQIASKKKEILVRSPLTCQTEKSVCQLCYGLDLAQGKLVSIGEAVGIIAAQSIGEPGTQLTMRTFHTGGVGVFSDQALKSFIAPFEGKIYFFDSLPGLFVRTPHGNIVYLLKHKTIDQNKPILRLTGEHGIYEILHSDIPSGSILWVKQGEIVKSGQLLIQASRLQTATQEMPESSHPVKSSLSGEVFFQSMAIRVIEEEKRNLQKQKKKKTQGLIPIQLNQKEIAPTFPTLVELGNFWVLSSFIQKEFGFAKSFFLKGDLVSQDTPIHQYDLHLPEKGQLKKLNSSVILGNNFISLFFLNLYYFNSFYFLVLGKEKTKQNLISYTSNSKQTILTCYPFFNNFSSSGYFSLVQSEILLNSLKTSEGIDFSKGGVGQKTDFPKLRYFWTAHQVFRLKRIPKIPQSQNFPSFGCLLTNGQNTLTKQGFFQFENYFESQNLEKSRFEQNFVENPLGNSINSRSKEIFLKKGLHKSKNLLLNDSGIQLIQKTDLWFCIPEKILSSQLSSQNSLVILQSGKKFENVIFENTCVSTNLIKNEKFFLLQSNKKSQKLVDFYSIPELLTLNKEFVPSFVKRVSKESTLHSDNQINKKQKFKSVLTKIWRRETLNNFCFYKKIAESQIVFSLKTKRTLQHLLSFQKASDKIITDSKYLKQNLLGKKKVVLPFSTNSPLFTKQIKTKFNSNLESQSVFKIITPMTSDWVCNSQILKIEISIDCLKTNHKLEELQEKLLVTDSQRILKIPGFNLTFYRNFRLKNSNQFSLQSFQKGWVLPEYSITSAYLKSKKLGEFRGSHEKKDQIVLSLLRNSDQVSFKLPQTKNQNLTPHFLVGAQIRWGHEIFSGFGLPISGQIVKLTAKTVTLRKAIPLLASVRGLIHISHNEFIEKNDLLITLRSRRLQTEDIVQGIPKIEQLFEARETQGGEIIQNNMHTLLNNFFNRAKQVKPIPEAVQLSLSYIQKFLVDNILEAYSTQGVHIAEKHVEVVVRQMTTRVRITEGGDSGLLPGEFIQIRLIEKVNQELLKFNRRPAHYEPVILGITKSVLQSESFLLAASFQQVSKVLVRSALAKKTDFLRGLHENILVGQAIPAGTGIIDLGGKPDAFIKEYSTK